MRSTGVYCRPVCHARTPARERCVFFTRAAEAEKEGFRACLRCRPELAPGHGVDDALPRLVRAAVAAVEGGALQEGSLEDLSRSLGVSARHLRRAVTAELGVSPVELGQTHRVALARRLLLDSTLPVTEIAYASGFRSLRRFHALLRSRLGRPPSELRRGRLAAPREGTVALRLDYRPPLEWNGLLHFLAARAVPGVEVVTDGRYARTLRVGEERGWLVVGPQDGRSLRAEVSLSLARALPAVVSRLRRLFDLDARPDLVSTHLGTDPLLAPLVRARPGLRLPGSVDGLETAVRAVLGQRIAVAAATRLAGRLVSSAGPPIDTPVGGLARLFPSPAELLAAPEAAWAGIRAQARSALVTVAGRLLSGRLRLDASADPETVLEQLGAIAGVGDWTAHYVALRALGWPDAFPASDLHVRRSLGGLSARATVARAESWRPWRAYAVLHLWSSPTKELSP